MTVLDPMAEFEAPEADPAEADPEEAEPGCRVFLINGPHGATTAFATPEVISGYVASGFLHGVDSYSPVPHAASLHRCPIHGAGCEAWA